MKIDTDSYLLPALLPRPSTPNPHPSARGKGPGALLPANQMQLRPSGEPYRYDGASRTRIAAAAALGKKIDIYA